MIEVKEYEDRWAIYVDGDVLATSKARFDADAAKVKLDRYIEKIRQEKPPEDLKDRSYF